MSNPEMDLPTQSLADTYDAETAHDEREGEFRREQDAAWKRAFDDAVQAGFGNGPPRASAVPARVTKILALNDLTLAEAQRMDDDELMGIPQIGPASFAYIRGLGATMHTRSAFVRAIARIQRMINRRGIG
mgnify:CR=1 FL=1